MENSKISLGPKGIAPLSGHCMCGAVSFEINEPLIGGAFCWCTRCQRRTGTAFSTSGLTVPGSTRFTGDEDQIRVFEPGDGGWNKCSCRLCGGQTHTFNPENPDVVLIRFGALDQDPVTRPMAHQFVDYAPAWYPVPDDGLPRFPERLDWSLVDFDS